MRKTLITEIIEQEESCGLYKSQVKYDKIKPGGIPRNLLVSNLINRIGFNLMTSLKDGLFKTYKDFIKNNRF